MAGTSYGLIEVSGVVAAIDSLDAMCKAAEVNLVTWERKLGGRLVTVIVEGSVADVKAAVEAATDICKANRHILAASGVIAAPADETRKMVALSAKRIKNKLLLEQDIFAEIGKNPPDMRQNIVKEEDSKNTAKDNKDSNKKK